MLWDRVNFKSLLIIIFEKWNNETKILLDIVVKSDV